MPEPKRVRRERTDEWAKIKQYTLWSEQELYEAIRPLVLFGETAGERAKEIDVPRRTLSRKANEFEHSGMQSLFSSGEQGGQRETSKTLPPEIRQLIVDLHAEAPFMSWREIAEVCYLRYGRKPDHKSVKHIATSSSPRPLRARRYLPWDQIPDPAERRLAVIRLHSDIRKIGVIGCLWRDHVGVALLRNGTADPYACGGKTPEPSMGDVVGPLMSM
jgi:putative transposase